MQLASTLLHFVNSSLEAGFRRVEATRTPLQFANASLHGARAPLQMARATFRCVVAWLQTRFLPAHAASALRHFVNPSLDAGGREVDVTPTPLRRSRTFSPLRAGLTAYRPSAIRQDVAAPLRVSRVRDYLVGYAPENPLSVIAVIHDRRKPHVIARFCGHTRETTLSTS